ncbi:MAG: 50S ribosomal protein L3 [Oscillospiraceae bacterium]
MRNVSKKKQKSYVFKYKKGAFFVAFLIILILIAIGLSKCGGVKDKILYQQYPIKYENIVEKYSKEFKLDNSSDLNVGDILTVEQFEAGETVDVTGTSKGHGFCGTIKRWGTHRGPMTHGSHYHRGPGSLGMASDPSRVFKGKRLPGHYGVDTVTIQNLDLIKIDTDRNLLLVRGSIPGPKGGLVIVKNAVKAKA